MTRISFGFFAVFPFCVLDTILSERSAERNRIGTDL